MAVAERDHGAGGRRGGKVTGLAKGGKKQAARGARSGREGSRIHDDNRGRGLWGIRLRREGSATEDGGDAGGEITTLSALRKAGAGDIVEQPSGADAHGVLNDARAAEFVARKTRDARCRLTPSPSGYNLPRDGSRIRA